jgi:hypothetical protein
LRGDAVSEGKSGKWGLWILVNAAVAGWLVYDMATASEEPSQALAILQYVLLACAVVGLVGSTIKYLSAK